LLAISCGLALYGESRISSLLVDFGIEEFHLILMGRSGSK